jgi:hypothetical protein
VPLALAAALSIERLAAATAATCTSPNSSIASVSTTVRPASARRRSSNSGVLNLRAIPEEKFNGKSVPLLSSPNFNKFGGASAASAASAAARAYAHNNSVSNSSASGNSNRFKYSLERGTSIGASDAASCDASAANSAANSRSNSYSDGTVHVAPHQHDSKVSALLINTYLHRMLLAYWQSINYSTVASWMWCVLKNDMISCMRASII